MLLITDLPLGNYFIIFGLINCKGNISLFAKMLFSLVLPLLFTHQH